MFNVHGKCIEKDSNISKRLLVLLFTLFTTNQLSLSEFIHSLINLTLSIHDLQAHRPFELG